MEFLDPALEEYSATHSSPENEVLADLNRTTNSKVLQPRMLSGHLQGRVLSMLSKLKKPKYILEIGTYTGYSAICLAEGLQKDGELHTIDINEELKDLAESYFQKSNLIDKIILHNGNALDIIPKLDHKWDIVFIDADKENYVNYYKMIIDRMNKDGLIIADNVLWSGKVLHDDTTKDLETSALKEFNKMVQNDERVENLLLPVRDGLMLAKIN